MMPRLLTFVGIAALGATLFVSVVHAQSPSPSRSPTSDPQGPALVIGCDRTVTNKSFCSTDSDVCCFTGTAGPNDGGCVEAASCPAEEEGGPPGACVAQPIFIDNECTIDSFFNQFVFLAQWGVSFVVILGLLLLIWGGIQWITAAGRASKIEEGKRIVTGTIVGIIISFSAYIIVNFTIAAITGTTRPSANPFAGPIATLFGNRTIDGDSIERPFSGDGQTSVENVTDCNAAWDNGCANQIWCADRVGNEGRVTELQMNFDMKGCRCGTVDGCFGKQTATCVRRWQIANSLEPTGMVTDETADIYGDPVRFTASQRCDTGSVPGDEVDRVLQQFPVLTYSGLAEAELATGCCVIKARVSGSPPLFCSDHMSARTCLSLGEGTIFKPGAACALDADTRSLCGFCNNGGGPGAWCFGQTGQYWCEEVVPVAIPWEVGSGRGSSLCPNLSDYHETLRVTNFSF